MGTIALVEKDEDVYYNGIKIYKGSGHVDAGGWGVRERSSGVKDKSVMSLLYPPPVDCDISYVSFRVQTAGVPATDEVIFSIWKKAPTAIVYTRVYAYTINEAVIQAQYGSGTTFADNSVYTIQLPVPVHINQQISMQYFVVVYSAGAQLDYDTAGSINGAYYVAADMSASATYAEAALTLADYAVSFECFTEPDAWAEQDDGGAIAEAYIDWQNASWCSSPGGEWSNPVNIYGAGVATSTANSDALYIDLGASAALPTGDAWDPSLAASKKVFPDYTAYGVRAISTVYFSVDLGGSNAEKIYIQVNDTDDDTQYPVTGWQTMYTIEGANAVTGTVYIPVIARWVRFVKGGADTNQCDIDVVTINTITYEVDHGDFPVNMVNSHHHCWVDNYPTEVKIYKASVKNMAGAEGSPGLPFTNRENVD